MNNSCVSLSLEENTHEALTHSSTSPAGYGYTINSDGTATISYLPAYPADQANIVLPSEVDGYPIRDYYLSTNQLNVSSSKHVFIPEGIQSIGGMPLVFGPSNHVWLPCSVKSIEKCIASGFSRCENVLHVYPDSYAQQYAQEKKYHFVLRDEHDMDGTGISDTGSASRTMI